jgi:hypothetical protein
MYLYIYEGLGWKLNEPLFGLVDVELQKDIYIVMFTYTNLTISVI